MGAQGCVSVQWEQLWSLELQGPTCRAHHPWAKSSWTTCNPWPSLTGWACGNPTQERVTQHFLSAETRNRLGKDLWAPLLCPAPKPEHTKHQWAQKSKHTSAKRLIYLLQEEGATAARYSCRVSLSRYLSAFHFIIGPASKIFYDLLKICIWRNEKYICFICRMLLIIIGKVLHNILFPLLHLPSVCMVFYPLFPILSFLLPELATLKRRNEGEIIALRQCII